MSTYSSFPVDHRGRKYAKVINSLRLDRDDLAHTVLVDVEQKFWDGVGQEAMDLNKLHVIEWLLPPHSDPDRRIAFQLARHAVEQDQINVLDMVFPALDEDDKNRVLGIAVNQGKIEMLQKTIELGADPHYGENIPIFDAVIRGHKEIIETLLIGIAPQSLDEWIIFDAANNGDTNIVELLIPFSQPKSFPEALVAANDGGFEEIVDLLYPHCSAQEICDIVNEHKHGKNIDLIARRWNAQCSKEVLTDTLQPQMSERPHTRSNKL